jgi:hypothetical protein
MSESGQNPRLPHRNIDGRSSSISRHYASEAVQPFVAPSMSSLDSAFVLRAIQVFGSTIAKAWRCRAFNSFSASTVSNSVNTSGGLKNTRRHPIDRPLHGNEFALCGSMGETPHDPPKVFRPPLLNFGSAAPCQRTKSLRDSRQRQARRERRPRPRTAHAANHSR